MKITIKIEAPERSRSYEHSFETKHHGQFEKLKEALNFAMDWYEMYSEKKERETKEALGEVR